MASIGPIVLVSAGATQLLRDRTPLGKAALGSAAAIVLIVLGWLVWNQSRVYENEETLWRDTIAKNPTSWMAQTNLGRFMLREGRFEEAVEEYGRVFAIKSDVYRARIGRAGALVKLGREREAEADFEAALELKPDLYTAHQALARLSWKRGARGKAIHHYQQMIAIEPQNPTGHFLLGRALESRRQLREALVLYRKVLELDPQHEDALRAIERIDAALGNPAAER